jgi:uncharacterized membrane protein YagU involved in acid resistance
MTIDFQKCYSYATAFFAGIIAGIFSAKSGSNVLTSNE